jgi:hypothetical protein
MVVSGMASFTLRPRHLHFHIGYEAGVRPRVFLDVKERREIIAPVYKLSPAVQLITSPLFHFLLNKSH